jgi:arylsulfatase
VVHRRESGGITERVTVNVLLIVIDTLRADHLGCYGYERSTSPNMDAFALQSVVFEHHTATSIPTHPAFATINTGQYSITHGVVSHGGDVDIPRTAPWLPAIVHKNGCTTCAVDNLADWRYGFGRGYEFYIDPTKRQPLPLSCDNRKINARAIPWLKHHRGEPFYMMIHYWDPHTPYLPPRAYRKLFYKGDPSDPENKTLEGMDNHPLGKTWRETWFSKLGGSITDAAYIEALYDAEIRFCDEGIGQILKTLDELDLADETLVIIMSDHGELMYRHGIFFDHHGLYDGNLHVPLLMRHPSLKPRRVAGMSAHVDIAPTILDLFGFPIPPEMEGVSLAPWLRSETDEPIRDFVVSQECTWQKKWSIRTPQYKFIKARAEDYYKTPPRELYDLKADPNEYRNIADAEPEVAKALETQLESWIADKMRQNGLDQDPLLANDITLGKAWRDRPQP